MREHLFAVIKKDIELDFFSGSGAGGQHRNKHQNCVRLYHADSGVRVIGQSNRERQANIRDAFNALLKHPKFKVWHSCKIQEVVTGKSIAQRVNESMVPSNLLIETKIDGKWCQAI